MFYSRMLYKSQHQLNKVTLSSHLAHGTVGWLVGLCFQSRDVRERVSVIEAWPLAKVTLSVRRIAKYLPE